MSKTIQQTDSKVLAYAVVEGIQEVKGKDIKVLDLRKINNAVSDFYVICSGESTTQVDGINKSVWKEVNKSLSEKPWREEGKQNSEWILMDYVNVVVHIFYKENRDFYNLEGLWADAEIDSIEDLD